uniref:hypothetical protein n=1 Tax=Nocardia pseudovaccinii TaxID=189540 RepID=UPI000A036505|nr:hypothetical protein [Nocardia pseudovaccinii]
MCGYSMNADVNAAKNILAAGRAVTACGDLGVGRSAKQEPTAAPSGGSPHLSLQGGEDVKWAISMPTTTAICILPIGKPT